MNIVNNSKIKSKSSSQRGVALLMVTMSISILGLLVSIFIFRSQVDYRNVKSESEIVKAQYLSYSVLEVTKLFLKVQSQYLDKNPMLSQLGFDMGQILPMIIPMFFGSGDLLTSFVGSGIDGIGLKPEQGTAVIESFTSDEGKINVNCVMSSQVSYLQTILLGLFSDKRYDELFGRVLKSGDSIDRQTQIAAFIDFIDMDNAGLTGGDEDEYYKSLPEPYLSKNQFLDSVSEISLIKGVDDIFSANFASSLTVYGSCKINLCAIEENNWQLIAAIIIATAKKVNDPVVMDPINLKKLATTISPQMKGICKDPSSFVQAVQNPGMASMAIASLLGSSVESMSDLGNDGVNDAEIQGVEIDAAKLQTITFSGAKRFYRIKAVGQAGKSFHTTEVVWDQLAISQTTNETGNYIFWKEN
jgi:Type II secretion system (T2SS), protein K